MRRSHHVLSEALSRRLALGLSADLPETQVHSVEPAGLDDMARSLASGKLERNDPAARTICDALMAPTPGDITFAVAKARVKSGFAVTDAEVKKAMEMASHYYVHMDELMDAVGKRLAELTKAEWGIVTNGCAAALAHATAACITGGDPEKMQRMPDLTGMKNEVIVPRYARNVYDHAVRMTGKRTHLVFFAHGDRR